jgi:hypothetical protein
MMNDMFGINGIVIILFRPVGARVVGLTLFFQGVALRCRMKPLWGEEIE